MDDTARVLSTAGLLGAAGITAFAWRLAQAAEDEPTRLIGQLRLSQVLAVGLAGVGALPAGLALAATELPWAHLDAAASVAFVVLAGYALMRPPKDALLTLAAGFIAHALFNLAHRPGWLSPDIVPRWHAVAFASFDLYVAAVCYLSRRR